MRENESEWMNEYQTTKHIQKDGRLKQNISITILNTNGLNTPIKVSYYRANSKLAFFIIFLYEI